ncbi:hypothetical protein GEMRC1_005777 [Eukaryota sp. GEM-RC1]
MLKFVTCSYDCNPCSKRVFARSNSTCQFYFFLAQTVIPTVFYLFPFRKWLFRTIYLLCSVVIPFLFITRIPFYKALSNIKYVLILSVWSGTALTYLVHLIYLHTIESADVQGLVVLGTWSASILIFGLTYLVSCKYFINMYYNLNHVSEEAKKQNSSLNTISYSVSVDSQGESEDIPSVNISIPQPKQVNQSVIIKKSWQVELSTRFLQPKPSKASDEDKEKACSLYTYWTERLAEDLDLLLSKTAFQLFVRENHMSVVTLTSTISAMDLDLSFRDRFLLSYYQKSCEELRRLTNTGHEGGDLRSSRIYQKNVKEVRELVTACLDTLLSFWKILAHPSAEVSKLPQLTDRLRKYKKAASGQFSFLTTNFPNKEVLSIYANYIRDVNMDEEIARSIEEAIDMQSASGSEVTGSQANSQVISGRSVISRTTSKGRKRTAGIVESLDTSADGSKAHKVTRLSTMMFISFTLVVVVTLVSMGFYFSTMDDLTNRVQQLIESSHILVMSNKLTIEAIRYGTFFMMI